ncbi:putative ATPase family protein [Trypanosoma vivax]|nr:putative ATPase family protein [Trypanosoma vivax]
MPKRKRCEERHQVAAVNASSRKGPRVAVTFPEGAAPQSHLDLFTPLFQYYVLRQPSSATTVGTDQGGKAKLDAVKSGVADTVDPAAALQHRIEVLRSFVIPTTVNAYLRRVELTSQTATPFVNGGQSNEWGSNNGSGNRNAAGDRGNNGSCGARSIRSELQANHQDKTSFSDEDDALLNDMQRATEALLPPFQNDSEYLAACEMGYVLREWSTYSAGLVSGNGQLQRTAAEAGLDLFLHCRPCQSAVVALYTHHMSVRLHKMALPPRVIRLSTKLELHPHEVTALTYLLVCHCGSVWPLNSGISGSISPAAVALNTELSSFQLMHFLADYREHMKQGVVQTDVKTKTSFTECRLAIPQEVIAALSGDNMSQDQLIKLEKTALAEVLFEEFAAVGCGVVDAGCNHHVGSLDDVQNREKVLRQGARDGKVGAGSEAGDGLESCGSCSAASTPQQEAVDVDPISFMGADALVLKPEEVLQQESSSAVDLVGRGSIDISTSPSGLAPVAILDASRGSHCLKTSYSPYSCDIEYMDESFKLLANIVRLHGAESDMKDEEEAMYVSKNKVEATRRELRGKVRIATAIHQARTEATLKCGVFVPRIEVLSGRLGLSELEKRILLMMVGNVVSHDVLVAINGRYVMRDGQRVMTVGYILFVLCDSLKERVEARKSFYMSRPLISNGILSLSLDSNARSCFNTDLMDYIVDIDRKIVDYLMGIETETAELVPGSRLYTPDIPIQNVILPRATTDLVLSTIEHYSMFEQCKQSCGFGKGLGNSSSGLVFLFYGPSGTGKTMLANAVAHELHKRILLVNLLHFKNDTKVPEMLRFIFREAKLNDAMIFFDECESLFEAREVNPLVTSILTEFEKYDGLVVLATNKAQVIDEAMNRRISLMVEFRLPDQQLREQIWQAHIPKNLMLHEDVSVNTLAINYELSGGLIRNAVLAAINKAVARERTTTPALSMKDLEGGARLQLRGLFLAAEKPPEATTESYSTPKRSLSELVTEPLARQQLEAVARLAKGRSTLFAQWGFNEDDYADQGALYLFYGPTGCGKSLAAEGIAYECGATIRLCNVAELMLVDGMKVHTVFSEARKLGAIIVFDQAQVLFNHSEQGTHIAKIISFHAKRYPRPIIFLATTGTSELMSVDVHATPLVFQQQVRFSLPSQPLRRLLWSKALPEKIPLDEKGINLEELSEIPVSGKLIYAAAFNACCKLAMKCATEQRLTMQLLREELKNVQTRERQSVPQNLMFA